MFFIAGINTRQKNIPYTKFLYLQLCHQDTSLEVFMTYTVFTLFFIPIFKWNKKYYVRTYCDQSLYALDPEVGKRLNSGQDVTITMSDLTLINQGRAYTKKICRYCGYQAEEDFEYCPKCGRRFDA